MSDLANLSPAPWTAWRREQQTATEPPTHGGIFGVNPFVTFDRMVFLDADFAEFAALARNAFDVMMRRGLWAYYDVYEKAWFIDTDWQRADHDDNDWWPDVFKAWATQHKFTDPFAALVEADKWFHENVEKVS